MICDKVLQSLSWKNARNALYCKMLWERKEKIMKYISFAIPCYNSEDYMAHAIESILPGGDDVEIIVVNDGSKDNTSRRAREFDS